MNNNLQDNTIAAKTDVIPASDDVNVDIDQKKTIVEFDENKNVEKDNKPKKKFKILRIFVFVCIFLFALTCIFGIWNRWFRYDDKQLFISNWQLIHSDKIISIDEKTINLGPNCVMNYSLDTVAKVVNYTIGDMSGQSHYRFSWDTNQLALIETTGFDFVSTMFSDLAWFWDWSTCGMEKIDLSPAYTKNNKDVVNTDNTGIDDIMSNGQNKSILLDRIQTKTSKSEIL